MTTSEVFMTSANEPPKPIGEIIDHIERIREELFMLQHSLEKIESIDRALSDADLQNSK
jgi:hypothetical protein